MKYEFLRNDKCNFCERETSNNKVIGIRLNKSQGFHPKKLSGISISIIRCKSCNLVYPSHTPIPYDIQDHYGTPVDEYWDEEYLNHDPDYFSAQIKDAKRLLSHQTNIKALDIGAGVGKGMISMANAGFDCYGIEPSIPFRDFAINKMGIDKDALTLSSIEEMEFQDESFDFITFSVVLEHLYDPFQSIQKAINWLKPHGVIQIEVPSSRWLMSSIYNSYYRMIGTNYVTNLSPMHAPFHLYEFDIKSFNHLARRLPLEVSEYQYIVCKIFHLPKIFHSPLEHYMKATDRGMQLNVWLRKLGD